MINYKGLSLNNLIIGLRAKERESEVEGRFLAVMSWNLRLYFVVTEYLIKRDFLDRFLGITVKDRCYTNHIDYEKWNNHQRYESTAPVFTVMGKFYGLPRLFERTHLFFHECFIYFVDRVDLLLWDGEKIVNATDILTS